MAMKTFEIDSAIRVLQQQMEEHAEANDGDVSAFELLTHLEDLEAMQKENAEHLLCNLACMALEYRDEAAAIRAQAKRLSEKAAAVEKKGEGIESFLESRIKPGEKVKDDRVTLSIRTSKAVEVNVEAGELPLDLQSVKVSADKVAIKKRLEAGDAIPGCELVIRNNLQIK